MVMQDFFFPKPSFFQSQFVYSGSILQSWHFCNFSKKDQNIWKFGEKCTKFENISK